MITDIDTLVPEDHLLRKIERVMDYEWLYERLDPYYNHEVGRPSIDPVVLVKMVLLQHLFGIPSLRQTHQRIQDTLSYRWFLGYGLLESIPHFATVSYAFCKRFPPELCEVYANQLREEVNAEREALGKKPIEDEDDTDDDESARRHPAAYDHKQGWKANLPQHAEALRKLSTQGQMWSQRKGTKTAHDTYLAGAFGAG